MTKSRSRAGRLLSLVICLVMVLCLVQPVTATEAVELQTGRTSVVRRTPSYSGAPIGQLEDGTGVTILDATRDFYKIDCYDTDGYIAKSQVTYDRDGKSYVKCDPDSTETRVFTYTDYSEAVSLRHSLFALAREQLGKPYIYGSTGMRGFDCSGLTSYLYGAHGMDIHRTASQQLQDGIIVSGEHMQVGDLVFFHESWDSYPASHVGIYVGNNRIIHASSSRGVTYDDLDTDWFTERFLCVRRVVDTSPVQPENMTKTASFTPASTGRRIN